MKGFKKDGKFIPTGNKAKSNLKKADVRKKQTVGVKEVNNLLRTKKTNDETGIGELSAKTRTLAEKEVGSEIEKNPYGNSYEFENGEEWLIFNNEKDAHKEAMVYMDNLFDDIGVDGWNKDFAKDFMTMGETDINMWASEDGDRFVEDRDFEELKDMNDSWKFGVKEPKGKVPTEEQLDKFRVDIAEKRSDYVDEILHDKGLEFYICDEEGFCNRGEFWEQYGERWLNVDKYKMFNASIDADGLANTLSGYDGKEVELSNGTLMYRHN